MPNYTMTKIGGRDVTKFSSEYGVTYMDGPLTQLANADYLSGQTLLAPVIMPYIPIPYGSTIIPLIGRGQYTAEPCGVDPGTECNRFQFDLERNRVITERRAIKSGLTLEVTRDSADDWRWRDNVTLGLTGLLNASLEKYVWDVAMTATNVSSQWTVKSAFTGAGNAMTSVLGLLDGVQNAGGFRPDLAVFGKDAWGSFTANSSALARCGGWVTPSRVAEVLRVNTVAIHDGQYNSVSGLPPVFTPFQTSDSVFAACTRGPRWGVRPYWTAPGITGGPIYVENYEDQRRQSSFIEVGLWTRETVVDATLAGTLLGVNSSQAGGL